MAHVRILIDERVVYDREVPPSGLKYNRTLFTPVSRHPGQEIIELRAASDGLEGYDDRWTL